MAVEIHELRAVVRAEIDDFEKRMNTASISTVEFGTSFDRAKQMVSKSTLVIGAAIAGVAVAVGTAVAAVSKLIDVSADWAAAAQEQNDANRKLEAVMRATGGAVGVTVEQINEFASARQKITDFGDEVTIAGAAILSTFTHIRDDAFLRTLAAAQDMSTLFGGELQGSVMQLAKALENPTQGLTMLRRAGVAFTQEQMELVKVLQEEGRLWEAQDLILTAVEGKFGGVAQATAHASTILKNTWGEIEEGLGQIVLPLFEGLAAVATDTIAPLADNAGQFEAIGKSIKQWMTENHDELVAFFKETLDGALKLGGELLKLAEAIKPLTPLIIGIGEATVWQPLITFLEVVSSHLQALTAGMEAFASVAGGMIPGFGGATAAPPAAVAPAAVQPVQGPGSLPLGPAVHPLAPPPAAAPPVVDMAPPPPAAVEAAAAAVAPVVNPLQEMLPDLSRFGELLNSLKGTVPIAELDQFAMHGLALRDALSAGQITAEQFEVGLRQLTEATNSAADAAMMEAEAKKQQALVAGDFAGAGLDFDKAVQEQAAALQMQQFNQQVAEAARKLLGLNDASTDVQDTFSSLGDDVSKFGEQIQDFGGQVGDFAADMKANGEQIAQGMSALGEFLNSRNGQIAAIQNQISNLQQFLTLESLGYRRRQEIIAQIEALANEITGLMQSAPPVLGVWRSDPVFTDPGLEGANDSGGSRRIGPPNVTVNSIFPPSAADRRMLVASIIEELSRSGWRV